MRPTHLRMRLPGNVRPGNMRCECLSTAFIGRCIFRIDRLSRNAVIAFIENNFPFRRAGDAINTVDTNAQASGAPIAVYCIRSCGKFTRNIHSFLMRLDNGNELGSVTPSQSDKIQIAKHAGMMFGQCALLCAAFQCI